MKHKERLKSEELSIVCEQIAMILRAGLPIHDGIEALCESDRGMKHETAFQTMSTVVMETGSLYEGMKKAGVFPRYVLEMTRIGERTGELDAVMGDLSDYYEREARNQRAVVNAVLYPLLLIGMMAVLIVVLLIKVLPVFESVFRGLGVDIASSPWMSLATVVSKGALIVAGVLIFLVLAVLLLLRLDRSGTMRRTLFKVISPLGRLERSLWAGRFASTLSMMLKSGYPLEESLELIEGLFQDSDVLKKVSLCRNEMEKGTPLPEAIEKTGMFEKLHCRMISVGYRAGQTDRVMGRLAAIYEERTEEQIGHLVSIIEPSLVALMSVIIGAILLAVMLPLLSIMNGLG